MEQSENPIPEHDDGAAVPAVSSRTSLLRAAADGEMGVSESIEFEMHLAAHPQDGRVIEFERLLRDAVAKSVGTGVAPDSLRARVASLRHSARTPANERADRLSFSATSVGWRQRTRPAGLWLAMAASLSLVVGAGYVVLTQIDQPAESVATIPQQFRTSLVSFVGAQHEECEVHVDQVGKRFKTTSLDNVPREFASVLGTMPDIGHIGDGDFKLLGAGPCAVPGRGKSVRMVLELRKSDGQSGDPPAIVSVHIQQDTGELALELGRTYRLLDRSVGNDRFPEIFVWRREGFVYFLISRSAAANQIARSAFGVQEPSGSI